METLDNIERMSSPSPERFRAQILKQKKPVVFTDL